MVEKIRKKPMKVIKRMKKQVPIKIEKKPLTPEERKKELQKDLLRIARRYEEMKLFDEAIKYYKKLGMTDDVERIESIKNEIYLKKARDFEAEQKYEDALRLYENLKMTDDVDRINRLLGNTEVIEERAPQEQVTVTEHSDELAAPERAMADIDSPPVDALGDQMMRAEPTQEEIKPPAVTTREDPKKTFKICPYCGEELNLPKKPNFCPYCKERLV